MQALAAESSDRFFGSYSLAEYRLVSPNITRCHFVMNATLETSNSRPRVHNLTPNKSRTHPA